MNSVWKPRLGGLLLVAGVAALVIVPAVPEAQKAVPAPQPQFTFTRDVAPIFQRSCQNCHRPGSIAPMSLLTFEAARPWARSIKQKVSLREMPPWYVDRNIGISKFKDDPSLTDAEVETIVKWVDSGAPKGNPADMPPDRQFDDLDKWHIGTPDLIVMAPEHKVAAVGPDQWLDHYADSGLTEDRYLQAVETKPNTMGMRVIHHSHQYMVPAASIDDPSAPGSESINEYQVGKNADIFPEGSGHLIKAGSKIRFNVHYHSIGQAITAQTAVAMKFYPKGVVPKHVVHATGVGTPTDGGINLDIPAGASDVRQDSYHHFATPVKITAFQPHMHSRGKRECIEVVYPNSRTEVLNCANFNFGWGLSYNYADDAAPLLPAGSVLHVIDWHDNSAANRNNPDPRNWVGLGNRTVDEMAHSYINWYSMTEEEYKEEVSARRAQQKKTTNNQ